MLLETITARVPAQPEIDADLAEYGELSQASRATYGEAACKVGDPDHETADAQTSASDTIANILHWLAYSQDEKDIEAVLSRALRTYQGDLSDGEQR